MEGKTDDKNEESNGIYYPQSAFFYSGREDTLELDVDAAASDMELIPMIGDGNAW